MPSFDDVFPTHSHHPCSPISGTFVGGPIGVHLDLGWAGIFFGSGDNDPEPLRGVPRGDSAFGRKSSNQAQRTQLALLEAHNPLFSTTGAAHLALHLRLLLLRVGDVEVNPGPVCSGCTGTIRVGSHPIICTQMPTCYVVLIKGWMDHCCLKWAGNTVAESFQLTVKFEVDLDGVETR